MGDVYVIAILMNKYHTVLPLMTKRRYGREAALLRCKMLEETCAAELKALDGERFIPYRVDTE